MVVTDINKGKKQVVLLLHPSMFTAECMKILIADPLGDSFRYIIPDFSSHGKASEKEFHSAEEECKYLYRYLKENKIDEVDLALGISLGAVVLLSLLLKKDIRIKKAIFDGCSLWQKAHFLSFLIKTIFYILHGVCIRYPSFATKKIDKIFGVKIGSKITEQFLQMDLRSLQNVIASCADVLLPSLSEEEQRRCLFLYGSKEMDYRHGRKVLKKQYPFARIHVWKGHRHCTKIVKESDDYCRFIRREFDCVPSDPNQRK